MDMAHGLLLVHYEEVCLKAVIAIVEDDLAMLSLLKDLLEMEGFEVLAHAKPADFLTQLATLKSPPDLLLSDVHLPGQSGIELLHELNARGFQFPVILISAAASHALATEAEMAGAKTLMRKPFALEDLMSTIDEHLIFPPPAKSG